MPGAVEAPVSPAVEAPRPAVQPNTENRRDPIAADQMRSRSLFQKAGDYLTKMANRQEPPKLTSDNGSVAAAAPVEAPAPGTDVPPVAEAIPAATAPVMPEASAGGIGATSEPVTTGVGIPAPESVASVPPTSEPTPTMTSEEAAAAKKLQTEAYMKITTLLSQDIAVDADPEELMQKLHVEKGWVPNDKTIDYIKGAIKFKQDKVAEEAREEAARGVPAAAEPDAGAAATTSTSETATSAVPTPEAPSAEVQALRAEVAKMRAENLKMQKLIQDMIEVGKKYAKTKEEALAWGELLAMFIAAGFGEGFNVATAEANGQQQR